MKYFKDFKKLCTPASVYLFINVIIFVSIAIQNFGNTRQYCVGQYKCNVPNTFSMFLFKAVYMLFWTFILNAICKAGYKEVSWFMVLLPIILLFIIIGIVILNSGSATLFEGFKEGMDPDVDPASTADASIAADADVSEKFQEMSASMLTEKGGVTENNDIEGETQKRISKNNKSGDTV